jgi:hypothetical protein
MMKRMKMRKRSMKKMMITGSKSIQLMLLWEVHSFFLLLKIYQRDNSLLFQHNQGFQRDLEWINFKNQLKDRQEEGWVL